LPLVSSQDKAVQVRSICKPLKPLGIHSVSLHPGASIEHQISGLKTCEPEFLIATPESLLNLVSLKAIDISGVSMLVIDGLKCLINHNINDKIFSIRDAIPYHTISRLPSSLIHLIKILQQWLKVYSVKELQSFISMILFLHEVHL
jgi:superfamily II DNA/RNA helicase